MKIITLILASIFALFGKVGQSCVAETYYYQPTKYPKKKYDGSSMPENIKISHVWDGWFNNSFNKTLVQDDKLQIGGWGDYYSSIINFDLDGLPNSVNNAYLCLFALATDSAYPSQVSMYRVTSPWTPSVVGWNTFPKVIDGYYWPVSTYYNGWRGYEIKDWYNGWKNGTFPNNGMLIFPYNSDGKQRFDVFSSSRVSSSFNASDRSRRPFLLLDFTPTLRLKMPLPGNHSWYVTTEIGGYDCIGKGPWPDLAHQNGNYFSIDFSSRSITHSGGTTYTTSSDIPVIAAASGKIVDINFSNPYADNGYYIVVDHDNDGNIYTGFTTRYLHLKYPPRRANGALLRTNDVVLQGEQLGIMGNTGKSTDTHLHFGVRYKNNGAVNVPELSKVVMDGWLLKSFQTETRINSLGIPETQSLRYYRSLNRSY